MPTISDVRLLAERHIAAWNAHDAEGVAQSYAPDAVFSINGDEPMRGRPDIAEMVRGFAADFPDMKLSLDGVSSAGTDAVYIWTFEGTHKDSGNQVRFSGWEAWTLTDACLVGSSLGYFDSDEYARQLSEGIQAR